MKAKNYLMGVGISVVLSLWMIIGCQSDRFKSRMMVKLTDAPGIYQEVNIDIRQVEIHYNNEGNSFGGWVTLRTNFGIYDLIQLQNNVTAILADDKSMPSGHVTQMRLILGDRNTVVTGGVEYNLEVPSSSESGLKINMNVDLIPNSGKEIVLDFDAEKSIVVNGDSSFFLKPVIQIKSITTIER